MKKAKRSLKNQISADLLVKKLLVLSKTRQVCLLDSCGVSHLKSHFLICGIDPLETFEISHQDPEKTLRFLDEKLETDETFAIFTISYDFGLKLEKITPRKKSFSHDEPDVFLALFDCLIVHDYNTKETFLLGSENRFCELEQLLNSANSANSTDPTNSTNSRVVSNFTKAEYLEKIEEIKEFIRRGDTYQTNLTQQFTADLPEDLSPQQIFYNLRRDHPAPFASFIQRKDSTVISASPERFFKVSSPKSQVTGQKISTSPIKGTRPRGKTDQEDTKLKNELLNSEKDRAENVMIVDLLRNDLGRICEFGSVLVEKLCDLEQHPTLFHLVSTVSGNLRENTKFSDIIRAVFPCGSITGAPKIRTMQIIDELETDTRGLSMGAIGFSNPKSQVPSPKSKNFNKTWESGLETWDLSVAIRTMTVKNHKAVFNVGGGIVIDSNPEDEYEETLTKAKALLKSINGTL
ncbi:MAG TPA: aminodeoxychorismate synthase component I [Pyrinomonadaceae bacterium]|nr:aminodeoxychorismate synthase component I [Pyrinomonadaceae bacterium]